jgi:hypothetical protein
LTTVSGRYDILHKRVCLFLLRPPTSEHSVTSTSPMQAMADQDESGGTADC